MEEELVDRRGRVVRLIVRASDITIPAGVLKPVRRTV